MRYRREQYQAYIRSLQQSRRRDRKTRVWLLLLLAVTLTVYFGLQLQPVLSCILCSRPEQKPSPLAMTPANDCQARPVRAGAAEHPGLRKPWDQSFGSSLETKTLEAGRGDTLIRILQRAQIPSDEVHKIIETLKTVFDPASLRQGQQFQLDFVRCGSRSPVFQGLHLKLDARREIQLMRGVEAGYYVKETERKLQTRDSRASATITSSLYHAAKKAGMPIEVLMQMMQAYAYNVDFQRDLQPGDRIEVLYEEKVGPDGHFVRAGDILYAALHTRSRHLRLYRHETSGGKSCLFDEQGNSMRKALMLTPIDGAKISSGYGMRKHPILGYNKMHQGLDFAAPRGSAIMAAGDGIVEAAGPRGTYGHYIRIRHPNHYKTVYAHLSGYAGGIRSGTRVRQGETIGYVGSTGRSTGPHLHFEVRYRGKPVNPAKVDTPPGKKLEGRELQRFLQKKKKLEQLYASLGEKKQLASAAAHPRETDPVSQ
ncbi:MAG: M23 family metallopeptidase [Desulfosalsimonadaceae bacterium]